MSEFVFLYRGNDRDDVSARRAAPEEMQKNMQKWMAWLKQLAEKGHVKDNGQPLDLGGRTVRAKKSITDGPFAEKDVVMGYSIIRAKDLDEAARLADGCPILERGGAVEVRQVLTNNM